MVFACLVWNRDERGWCSGGNAAGEYAGQPLKSQLRELDLKARELSLCRMTEVRPPKVSFGGWALVLGESVHENGDSVDGKS